MDYDINDNDSYYILRGLGNGKSGFPPAAIHDAGTLSKYHAQQYYDNWDSLQGFRVAKNHKYVTET